jgi:hypothetical protein
VIYQPSIWAALKDRAEFGVFDLVGSGVPISGVNGAGVNFASYGSTYINSVTGEVYRNFGTALSPLWSLTDSNTLVQKASGVISSANITGTAVGQLGHAQGVPLTVIPPAGVALQLISAAIYYTFGVAAYTLGGNLTINWGAGGAALTGLVSNANSIGAASSKAVQFYPLSTAGVPLVSAASLNLVSSAAFTNPGTATGTVAYDIWYRIANVGF